MTIMKNVEFDVAPLFPTPVGYYHVRDFKNTYIDPDNYDENKFNHNTHQELTINSVSNNILLEPGFEELKEIINGMMEHYIYHTLMFPSNIKLNLCGDKAISVGESSKLELNNFIISNSVVGVSSKDNAVVNVDYGKIYDVKKNVFHSTKKNKSSMADCSVIKI